MRFPLDRATALGRLGLLAGVLAGCRPEPEVGPRFEPPADSVLRTHVQQDSNQELVLLEITIDGEPLPAELVGDIGVAITSHADFLCEDRVQEVRGGRVRRYTRHFVDVRRQDDSRSTGPEGEVAQTTHFTSPLTGRSVVFEWNERDSRYRSSLEEQAQGNAGLDPEQEATLLAGLAPALDLRAFLPAPGASPGSEWPVSPRALAQLVLPGGDMAFVDQDQGQAQPFDARLFAANLQGSIHATYLEPEPDQDPDLAVIALSVRVDTAIEHEFPAEEDEFGQPIHSRLEIGYRLSGRLRWDVTGGHARDLELEGRSIASSTQTVTGGAGDELFEQVDRLRFEGTTRIRVEVEKLP